MIKKKSQKKISSLAAKYREPPPTALYPISHYSGARYKGGWLYFENVDKNIYIYIYIFTFSITMFLNFLCNYAFEQGHLEPWRYRNDFIIIIIRSWCWRRSEWSSGRRENRPSTSSTRCWPESTQSCGQSKSFSVHTLSIIYFTAPILKKISSIFKRMVNCKLLIWIYHLWNNFVYYLFRIIFKFPSKVSLIFTVNLILGTVGNIFIYIQNYFTKFLLK